MKLLKILLGAALVAGQQGNEWEQPNGPFGKINVDPRTGRSNLIRHSEY